MVEITKSLVIRQKTRISKVDFMVLTKTWSNCNIDIPGFETISSEPVKPFHKNTCLQSGGIQILFKSKYKNCTTIIESSKNFLWIKLSKIILINPNKDIYICGTHSTGKVKLPRTRNFCIN